MFLDTSGLVCLFDKGERRHHLALSLFDATAGKLTTDYVLAEFVAVCSARKLARQICLEFVIAIHDGDEVMVEHVTEREHRAALELLANRTDKIWSLCDAVSFAKMQKHRLYDAFTTDHHFEQAGFVRLLK